MRRIRGLYVAQGFVGSTTLDRFQALRNAGMELEFLNTSPLFRSASRLGTSLAHRLGIGALIHKLNTEILRSARALQPEIVWVDKGTLLTKQTLLELKRINCRLIHFTPDPAIRLHATRHFLNCVPLYDLVITTKDWERESYQKAGARKLLVINQSTSLARTQRVELSAAERQTFETDVVFVGRPEEHYIDCVKQLSLQLPGVQFAVWGEWGKAARRHRWLRPIWRGRAAYGEDYSKALSGAKIALGLLTKLVPETETTRTFEIPACQTFLLGERTDSHMRLFQEGVEAEFFADLSEAKHKILDYLASPEKLERVAAAGHRRFLVSGYSSEDSMKTCVQAIDDLLRIDTTRRTLFVEEKHAIHKKIGDAGETPS